MFARYTSAVATGTLITLALLYTMQGLIDLQPGAGSTLQPGDLVKWVRLPSAAPPPAPAEPAFDKDTLSNAPVPPAGNAPTGSGQGSYLPVPPTKPPEVDTTLDGLSDPDSPLISIVRVQPTYPANQQARGIEGWVDVRFDVMTNGLVTNIVVTRSSHKAFEKAAIKAAQRFRFKAPVVNGMPQVARGIDYRFRFEMND